jgi:hypothetical protein
MSLLDQFQGRMTKRIAKPSGPRRPNEELADRISADLGIPKSKYTLLLKAIKENGRTAVTEIAADVKDRAKSGQVRKPSSYFWVVMFKNWTPLKPTPPEAGSENKK